MSAIDTAARFGEIPFVEFTSELITGVFDALVDAHILQVEEYSRFVQSLTEDLSTYINNTKGDVPFDDVAAFVQAYELPKLDDATVQTYLEKLEPPIDESSSDYNERPADGLQWWGGLINALAPVAASLVEKIGGSEDDVAGLKAITNYNQGIVDALPTYKEIHHAIASLLVSNKYGLLQSMTKQGMMRLVVTEGEIETRITFSTWDSSTSINSSEDKIKERNKEKESKVRTAGLGAIFRASNKNKSSRRTVTVNTAKSYQRDSSGSRVDIFGRVLIKFKTDYAPLNG